MSSNWVSSNATEVTKNICYTKDEDTVDHRWFKNCKTLDDQTRSGRRKAMDSKAVLQAMKINPASSTQRVSGELSISQTSVVHCLHGIYKFELGHHVMEVKK